MRKPTKKAVAAAKRALAAEDEARERARITSVDSPAAAENARRSSLPSEHPEHVCGMSCDGQDGANSYCARLRAKLFSVTKVDALLAVSKVVGGRPVRWAKYDRTLEVFDADLKDRHALLRGIYVKWSTFDGMAGNTPVVIFHSIQQTSDLYSDFRAEFRRSTGTVRRK